MSVARLARAAAVVALLGLVSRALGYVREAVLAGAYGTSAQADAFVNGLLIVNAVAAVLLYALVTLVIPVFQREREDHGEASAWRLVASLAGWVGALLVALASLAAAWPEGPAALFALEPERARITADVIRIMAPALALQGFSALFTALLQIHGRFAGPAAVGIAFNAGIIVAIALGHGRLGIEAAAWGVSAGALAQVLLQLPQLARVQRGARPRPALRHPRLAAVGVLALPVLGASALQQVNNFTDKLFASSLEQGRVAALSYANTLGQAPRVALLLPLLTPLFPLIARRMAERREDQALEVVRRVAGLLGLVAAPIMLLMAIYAREITELAFGRGRCGAECVEETAEPLFWYAFALWPAFLSLLLNRTLSAARRQRDILTTTAITVVVTIALDIALIGPMEQAGLALAAAIGVYANAIVLLAHLRRRFPGLPVRRLAGRQARVLAAGGAAAAAALLLDRVVPTGDRGALELAGPLALKLALAGGAFLAAARLLARPELAEAVSSLRALPRRRRPR